MNTLEVFITERVMGGSYTDNRDCPLYRALKDQHPNLEFEYVGGYGSINNKEEEPIFEPSASTPWDGEIHDKLKWGDIKFPYKILLEQVETVTIKQSVNQSIPEFLAYLRTLPNNDEVKIELSNGGTFKKNNLWKHIDDISSEFATDIQMMRM